MVLKEKVCVVTGGGSGIGRSAAISMAMAGAQLVLIGRTLSKVDEVRVEIEKLGGVAESILLDVGNSESVQNTMTTVLEKYGRVDVLVNNAGHSSIHRTLSSTTPEELQSVLESNLSGTIYCSQAVVPSMVKRKEGTIINVASIAGLNPSRLAGLSYSAAKAAVINFTGFLNEELRNTGVRVSVVVPGEVDTPIMDKRPVPPSRESRSTMVTAEDVADAIFLIANLPQRASVPELVIRPTYLRDFTAEVGVS